MPSSLLETPLANTDSYSKAGLDTNKLEKIIYSNYNNIVDSVYRIFEVSLGLTYDLYQSLKADKSNVEKYVERLSNVYFGENGLDSWKRKTLNTKELIEKFSKDDIVGLQDEPAKKDTICGSSDGLFAKFIKLILTDDSSTSDFCLKLDPKTYFTTISLLRNELAKKFNDLEYIKIDIGNTPNEFPYMKGPRNMWDNPVSSVAFKVIPKLINIYNSETGELRDSVPEFSYTINIDIHKLIGAIVTIFDPSDLPDAYKKCESNRDEYILNGSIIMKNFSTVFARKIILELYDNICNIRGNWKNFIDKCNSEYTRVCSEPSIQNIVGKLTHGTNIIGSIFGTDLVNKNLSDLLRNSQYKHYEFDTVTDWLSYASNKFEFGEFVPDNVAGVLIGIFEKAFEVFFSTGVMYKLYLDAHNTISNVVLWSYTKEFFAKYDMNVLLQNTAGIYDYNVKDFFQSIIKDDFYPEMRKTYSEKMSNGENVYFMFCKLRRLVWIKTLVEFKIYFTLIQNGVNNDNFKNKFAKTWKNIGISVFRLIKSTLENINDCEKYTYNKYVYNFWEPSQMLIPIENSANHTLELIKTLINIIVGERRKICDNAKSGFAKWSYISHSVRAGISSFDNIMLYDEGKNGYYIKDYDEDKWNNIINNFVRSGIAPIENTYDL